MRRVADQVPAPVCFVGAGCLVGLLVSAACLVVVVLVAWAALSSLGDFGDPEPGPARRAVLTGVDAATGMRRWVRHFHGRGELAVAPSTATGQLAVRDRAGDLRLLDAGTGHDVWAVHLRDVSASRPAIEAGVVLELTRDRTLHAYDLLSGAPRWSVPNAVGGSPPMRRGPDLPSDLDERDSFGVSAGEGVVVAVGRADRIVHAYDLAIGASRWQTDLGLRAASIPVTGPGVVLVRDEALTTRALALGDGSTRWVLKGVFGAIATSTTSGHHGDVILGFAEASPPPIVGGHVVSVSELIEVKFLDLVSGTERWTTPTYRTWGFVAFDARGSSAFVANDHSLCAYDAASGTKRWCSRTARGGELLSLGTRLYSAVSGHLEIRDAGSGHLRRRTLLPGPQATPVIGTERVLVLNS